MNRQLIKSSSFSAMVVFGIMAAASVSAAPAWPKIIWGGGAGINTDTPEKAIGSFNTNQRALEQECTDAGGMPVLGARGSYSVGDPFSNPMVPERIGPNYSLARIIDCIFPKKIGLDPVGQASPAIDYVGPEILAPIKASPTPVIDYVAPEILPPLKK